MGINLTPESMIDSTERSESTFLKNQPELMNSLDVERQIASKQAENIINDAEKRAQIVGILLSLDKINI